MSEANFVYENEIWYKAVRKLVFDTSDAERVEKVPDNVPEDSRLRDLWGKDLEKNGKTICATLNALESQKGYQFNEVTYGVGTYISGKRKLLCIKRHKRNLKDSDIREILKYIRSRCPEHPELAEEALRECLNTTGSAEYDAARTGGSRDNDIAPFLFVGGVFLLVYLLVTQGLYVIGQIIPLAVLVGIVVLVKKVSEKMSLKRGESRAYLPLVREPGCVIKELEKAEAYLQKKRK